MPNDENITSYTITTFSSVSKASAPYSLDNTIHSCQTDMKFAETHRKETIIKNAYEDIDKVRKMRPIVDKLIPNDDNLLKGYLLGLLVAHNRPTLFSQSNFGHPQTGERVIGFLPVPDSDETTSTILTRLEDGTWANNMTGEIIDRRKVLAWMPLPTVSQR